MVNPLLVMLAAVPGAVSFSPPLGVPLAYTATETRNDAGVERRFRSERQLVFRRAENGFVAEVTLTRADSAAADEVAGMFAAALGALEGRTIRIHLDRAGAVMSVEDGDALWERLLTALATMAPPGKAEHARALSAALRKLPPGARTAMLGSLVTPLIADDEAALTPGSKAAASIRARSPAGAPITIPATRHVSSTADGLLAIKTHAESDIPAPGGEQAHLTIDRRRLIDPATGLVRRIEERRRIAFDNGMASTTQSVVTLAEVS